MTVPAHRPAASLLDLPYEHTAVLVVDMQNDFCHADGFYNTRGGRPSDLISQATPAIRRILCAARRADVKAVFTRYVHPDGADITTHHEIKPSAWASHDVRLRPGSWGVEIVDELAPVDGELVIDKQAYSAFYETDLEQELRKSEVTHLVLTGTVAHACVLHTAFDAFVRGFDVVLVRDAISGWFDDLNHAAERIVELLLGVAVNADEVVVALGDS